MENIQFLKKELDKEIKDIDWKEFIKVSTECYKHISQKLILGLTKDVFNIIKDDNVLSSGLYDYLDTNKQCYTTYICRRLVDLNKIINENKLSDSELNSNKCVIIIISRNNAITKKLFNLELNYTLYKILRVKEFYFLTNKTNKIKFNKDSLVKEQRKILLNKILLNNDN